MIEHYKILQKTLRMLFNLQQVHVLSVLVDMGIFFSSFLSLHPEIFYGNGERWKKNHNSSFLDKNKENKYYVNGGQNKTKNNI